MNTTELREKYKKEHKCLPQLSHYANWLESQLEKEREFDKIDFTYWLYDELMNKKHQAKWLITY